MSHFIAFYRCSSCRQPIAGLVSDTILLVSTADSCDVIDPRKVKVGEELKLFCLQCLPQFKTGKIESECCICTKPIELFYSPEEITLIKLDGQRITVRTETLLTEYNIGAVCSSGCLKKRRQDYTVEPYFLEFQKEDPS